MINMMISLEDIKEKVRNYENKYPISKKELDDYDQLVRVLKEQDAYAILDRNQLEQLKDIPAREESLQFFDGNYRKICNVMKKGNITTLNQIFSYDRFQFLSIPTAGVSKWCELVQLRYNIKNRFEAYMEYCDYCIRETQYPILESDREYTLTEKVTLAYEQFVAHIKKIVELKGNTTILRECEKVDNLLLKSYDTSTLMDIFEVNTSERIRQMKVVQKRYLRRGYFDWAPNVRISPILLGELFNIENSRPIYKSEEYMNQVFQCESFADTIIPAFLRLREVEPGVSYRTYVDQNYWIPEDEIILLFTNYFKSIYSALTDKNADVRPVLLEQIMDSINQQPSAQDFDFSEEVVADILQHHKWIECQEENDVTRFQMDYNHLSAYQKLARIIFVHKHVSAAEAADIDKRWSNDDSSSLDVSHTWNVTHKHFPWVTTAPQHGYYEYNENGIVKPMLQEEVSRFAKEHVLFHFSELMEHLESTGYYSNLNPSSIRTYAMRSCQCANEDNTLLCLSEKIQEYPGYSWRQKVQTGITNWVISQLISFLKDADNFQLKRAKLNGLLKDAAKKSEEQYKVRDYNFYVAPYLGETNIFDYSEDEKSIVLTPKGRVLTDKEISRIGASTRTPDFYKDVIATIQTLLKESPTGEMLLRDLKAACYEILEGKPDTRFYKIVDTCLPDQIVKITHNNNLYLKLITEKIEYETSMVIDTSKQDVVDIETPTMKPETSDIHRITPEIGQRIAYNWNDLYMDMSTQLAFYGHWWNLNMSMEEAFVKFKEFVGGVDNRRLRVNIPQYMFEFWHFKNDEYDYYRFLLEFTLCYEQLLVQIHLRNTGVHLQGNGLQSIIRQMPKVALWASNSAYRSDGFNKNYRSLAFMRNQLAHGEDITDTFVMIIQRISSFIALYIYTVAKFLE